MKTLPSFLNRKISTPIGIIVIVFFALLFGGFLIWQCKIVPRESKMPGIEGPERETEGEISDWKTFRNKEYGYEVRYPPNWYVYDEDLSKVYFQKAKEEEIGFETQPFGPHSLAIEINVIDNPSNLSAKEWAVQEIHNGVAIGSEDEIVVGDRVGIKIIPVCEGIYCEFPVVYIGKDLKMYRFDQRASGEPVIFDHILSTFRFLEQ